MPLDDAARAKIAPYVSSLTDGVFALTGLPEEVIAVLFAYYSRSRDDLRTNLAKLLADDELGVAHAGEPSGRGLGLASDKARAFHEKWVVGYGHASVAEHAVVHLAIEDVSIVASKVIEDLRLGSYTEKSTRYVVFDTKSFVELPELAPELAAAYRQSGERLFATYLDLTPKVLAALERRSPRPEGKPQGPYNAAIRAQALDLLRGLLPSGTRTNLGLTANARALEMLLSKMLSSPLAEVRRLAKSMHEAAQHVTPTLVKYAAENAYRASLQAEVAAVTPPFAAAARSEASRPVRLVRHDADALARIALALAYEGSASGVSAEGMAAALEASSPEALVRIVRAAVAKRGKWDPPPRGFEASTLTVELTLDYGAYRDLQRHRMLTPATQRLGCELGFETPTELVDLGFGDAYAASMNAAVAPWRAIAEKHPLEAQYAVPLGFKVRTLWTMNVRELFHVVELRSAKQGHASYRRMAQALYREACNVHPWLADLVRVDMNDYALARA
jgi:thymidylate synthase ThyX